MIYAFMQARFIIMRFSISEKPIAPNRREHRQGVYCFETFAEAKIAAVRRLRITTTITSRSMFVGYA